MRRGETEKEERDLFFKSQILIDYSEYYFSLTNIQNVECVYFNHLNRY